MPNPPENFYDLEEEFARVNRRSRVIPTMYSGRVETLDPETRSIMRNALREVTLNANSANYELGGVTTIQNIPDASWASNRKGQAIFARLTNLLDHAAQRVR